MNTLMADRLLEAMSFRSVVPWQGVLQTYRQVERRADRMSKVDLRRVTPRTRDRYHVDRFGRTATLN